MKNKVLMRGKKMDMSDSELYTEDGMPIPKGAMSPSRHCWGLTCNKSTDMKDGIGDPPYGFVCKLCHNSLRQHPFFGQGKEYDLGDAQCVAAWKRLTKQKREIVYVRYGFPAPNSL